MAHFADIVRIGLLLKYGGYWIDSTYFIDTPLNKVNTTFFTIKTRFEHCFLKRHSFIKCLFSINFLAVPKNSFIATYGYIAILSYFKKYNNMISYFLLDYIFHIAYINIPKFKDIIDNGPFVDCNIFTLYERINSNYKKSNFNCPFNQLSHKGYFRLKSFNKGITNYGFIISNYSLDLKNIDNNIILNI